MASSMPSLRTGASSWSPNMPNGRVSSQGVASPVTGGPLASKAQFQGPVAAAQNHTSRSPSVSSTTPNGTQKPPHLEKTGPYDQLAALIKQTDPGTVRQVIRDQWEKCLLGSDFHVSFLLLATIHNASQNILKTVIQKNGPKIIEASRDQIAGHMSMEDLDNTSNILLSKASDSFLDKALTRRLETIPARKLLNSLARAERLGYDIEDMLTEDGSTRREKVTPSAGALTAGGITPQARPQKQPPPAPRQQERRPPPITLPPKAPVPDNLPQWAKVCTICNRVCAGEMALKVHVKKSACHSRYSLEDYEKNSCIFCGCGFITKAGLGMHTKGNICGNYSQAQLSTMMSIHHASAEWQEKNMHLSTTIPPTVNPVSASAARQPEIVQQNGGSRQTMHRSSPIVLPTSTASSPVGVPIESAEYNVLPPSYRESFEAELREAQSRYGQDLESAEKLLEPDRSAETTKIKNRWNTKCSNTRKKYGISLRGTRSKNVEDYLFQRSKRPRTESDVPAPSPGAWPAEQGGSDLTPRKLKRVSEMGGGLTGAGATAETQDPTAFMTQSQPRQSQTSVPLPIPIDMSANDPMEVDSDGTSEDEDSSSGDEDIKA